MSAKPRQQHLEGDKVLCPACHGIPIDHPSVVGKFQHHVYFDDTDPDGPVVLRCWVCNATVVVEERESWDKSRGNIRQMYITNHAYTQSRKDPSLFRPCDVCGGSGAVPAKPDPRGGGIIILGH